MMKLREMMGKLNKDWFLPTLQRDFVWLEKEKDKKVEKLLDSLMLGYPIGQIVIWKNQNAQETTNSMKVYRFLDHYEINGKNENGSQSFGETKIDALVLDGQQRLTSLYIATQQQGYVLDKDKITKKYLYVNLLYDADKNAVDEVTYKFDFKSKEDADKVDSKNLWFRISLLVENKTCNNDYTQYKASIINDLLNRLPKEMISDFEQKLTVAGKIDFILSKLWLYVREKEINCEIVETNNIDSLLEIFVRLNDGGVKLEKADLLLSFMESDPELFKPNGARETISNFVNETINNRPGELDKVTTNKDFVLKATLMLSKNSEKNLEIKYKIKNFTKNNLTTISTNWKNITETIETVYKLIDRYNFSDKTLTSYNALLPIAYYLQKNGLYKKSFVDSPEISYVEKRVMLINWLSKVLISGVFGGSSDTILKQYQEAIDSNSSSLNVLNSKKITQKDIEDLVEKSTYKDKYSQLILFLVTDPKYWHNSQDHIFPQNEFKGKPSECKKRMNSIGNLQLLSQPANSHKNGTSALDWASLISDEEKKANLYPDDIELKNENFVQFVEERKKLIIKKLCEKLEVEYKKDV